MSVLSQAYIHLKVEASLYELEAVEEYLSFIGKKFALELYGNNLDVNVRIEEGSLKTWVTTAGFIYAGIAGYGSFRSGIDHMNHDGRAFGELVSSAFIEKANVDKERVYRVERRLGVPGKIKRLLVRIDKLQKATHTNQIVKKELSVLQREVQDIVNHIDSESDAELFVSNLPNDFRNVQLPIPSKPIPNYVDMPAIRPTSYIDYLSEGSLTTLASNVNNQLHINLKK